MAGRRQGEPARGLFPVVIIFRGDRTQNSVSIGERRVQFQRPLCHGASGRHGLMRRRHTKDCSTKRIIRVNGVGQGELRIERDGLFVKQLGLVHRLRRYLPVEMLGLQEGFVGRKLGSVTRLRGSLRRQLELKRSRNGRRDFVLHGEYIRQLAVVALRPEMAVHRRHG